MNPLTNFIALVARILLGILFVQGGYNKLFGGIPGTVATMTSHGIPFPNVLVWGGDRSRARRRIVPNGRSVRALGGADPGGLYADARVHLPRLLGGAGGGSALRPHHLLQSPVDHRRHARDRGVRRWLPQPRCLDAAEELACRGPDVACSG